MSALSGLKSRVRLWVRATFARSAADRELAREMETHIAMERDHLIRQGVAPEEAEHRARRSFGGVQRFAEEVRDERGTHVLDHIIGDVRYAVRHFARAPWVTATIVVMLAVGIGINSALIAMVDALTLRPPAGVPSNSSVVRVRGIARSTDGVRARGIAYGEFSEYRARSDVFSSVAGATFASEVSVEPPSGGDHTNAYAEFVTSGYFSTLGVKPAAGSVLPADDDAANTSPGVFVSHTFWRSHLGGSDAIIGRQMKVGGAIVTIIGVAPPGFTGAATMPGSFPGGMIWLPFSARGAVLGSDASARTGRSAPGLGAVARLRNGVSVRSANAVVEAIGARAAAGERRGVATTSDLVPLRAGNGAISDTTNPGTRLLLGLLGTITILVLAIICANVSALIVGRAVGRQREIGVRLSLGASRGRLVRQLLTESALLSLAGGALGLVAIVAFARFADGWFPDSDLSFGWHTVALTVPFSIATSLLFGMSPALHATRVSVSEAMKESATPGTKHRAIQRRLIVAQVAMSQPLLVGLGVLLAAAFSTQGVRHDPDIAKRTLWVVLNPREPSNARDHAAVIALTNQVRAAFAGMPSVERVSNGVGYIRRDEFKVESSGRGDTPSAREAFGASVHPIGPGYFDLLRIRVARGREIDETDVAGKEPAAIIGSDLATQLWGDANPIGRRLVGSVTYTVVGVVDAAQAGPSVVDGRMQIYTAYAQESWPMEPAMFVRVASNAPMMISALRARLRQDFPSVPVMKVATLAEIDGETQRQNVRAAGAAAGAGLLALLLSAVGLYAAVAFAVNQRTREIGVRIAMGARASQVIGHFFGSGVRLSLIGSAIGLPASVYAVGRFMTGIKYQGPSGWALAFAISAVVTGVAMFASWLPARRAARVDPVVALRAE